MNPFRLLQSLLNRLLPFTRPGTPLLQDLVHTLALCVFLYFAPTIFENNRSAPAPPLGAAGAPPTDAGGPRHGGHTDYADDVPVPRDADGLLPAEHEGPDAAAGFADDDNDEEQFEEEEDFEAEDLAAFEAAAGGQHQPFVEDAANADGQPGPADPDAAAAAAAARRAAANRQVGAKKARSIARRDQRRAYHEFVRSQAEAQRAREAEGAEEREAELFEEKRRRAVAEAALEEKARKEREERRERERRAREEEMTAQQEALRLVRTALETRGAVEVRGVVERVGRGGPEGRAWLEKLLRADGLVVKGKGRDGCVRMITAGGWVVRVEESDMQAAWKRVAGLQKAKITFADLGEALEEVLKHRA
ncbi:hypothetical protein MPH_10276 [Macrophomina phaseolina MS6]|uniref:Uncharacterized protein n=1 Tax=Macrophomina phaseolina (strain MS6) TaxID=1126212 RepID=K2S6W4_MACPH|nr:hypothetical protein MPH_10276 [Macrophomina phaseolina MS6]